MRAEDYQLAAGKIQYPALFISKETTSGKHALKETVKYLDRRANRDH
jgi:hypothetical protein